MRVMVTGVAGFVGSRLAELLVAEGHDVRGVDCFSDYYSREQKVANMATLSRSEQFTFHEGDLASAPELGRWMDGVDVVFHQAAQAGVRGSWAAGFEAYIRHNVLATQKLLEAAVQIGVSRVVYASSSSVYGNAVRYPTLETDLPRPFSPYGVTKLAGEHLLAAYARNYGLPAVALRYHTVYGPRQRPDMAIHRLIRAATDGTTFRLFAAGDFVRDFTFVDDICHANVLAADATLASNSAVFNVAGGEAVSMRDLIAAIEELVGSRLLIEEVPGQVGDVTRTDGDSAAAREILGWSARTSLVEGLARQVEWHRSSAFVAS